MKLWKEFGSSHSANVTLIGEFDNEEKAEEAFPLLEDFTRADWEERYEDVEAFKQAWATRESNLPRIGINQMDYKIGVDNNPDVEHQGNKVVISRLRSENVAGLIKILFLKGMKEIRITGHGI